MGIVYKRNYYRNIAKISINGKNFNSYLGEIKARKFGEYPSLKGKEIFMELPGPRRKGLANLPFKADNPVFQGPVHPESLHILENARPGIDIGIAKPVQHYIVFNRQTSCKHQSSLISSCRSA